MARLKSTYSLFVEEQEKKGFVKSLSHEVTIRIDTGISKAFSCAQKKATVKQFNSVKLMRQRQLKGLINNANI